MKHGGTRVVSVSESQYKREEMSNQEYSVFVGNLEPRVTEEVLWELFLQAGPLDRVHIPKDRQSGKAKAYGFVEFTSQVSVPYACKLFNGVPLFKRPLKVNPSGSGSSSSPANQSPNRSPFDCNQDWVSNGLATPVRREGNLSGQNSPNLMYYNNMVTPDSRSVIQCSHSFPGNLQDRQSPWQQQQQQYGNPHQLGHQSPPNFLATNNVQQRRGNWPLINPFTPPGRGNWRR